MIKIGQKWKRFPLCDVRSYQTHVEIQSHLNITHSYVLCLQEIFLIIFNKSIFIHFLSISWFIFAVLYFPQQEKYMLESWPLCNLDKVRLKSLDLQLSGLFPTKAPQMTQCSSDVTVFNPNSLPDRSVPNPQPWKFLIWQSQKLLNRHRFGFFFFKFWTHDCWSRCPGSQV